MGGSAGVNTTTGAGNVFVGAAAGNGNTTGGDNVFVGAFTAHDAVTTASDNVLVGSSAGRANRGAANTFVGAEAGRSNNTTAAQRLSRAGARATGNTSGSSNVFLGYVRGRATRSGGANTLLGLVHGRRRAGPHVRDGDRGEPDRPRQRHHRARPRPGQDAVHIWGVLRVGLEGSGSLDVCRNANIRLATCSSSLRYKSDVAAFERGLDVVAQLRPIRFRWKRQRARRTSGSRPRRWRRSSRCSRSTARMARSRGSKYKQVTTVLVTAVQELARENASLRAGLERQRQETAALRAALCRAGLWAEGCE